MINIVTGRVKMKRKPKWWNIDWVELGCRGWDINVEGACCGEQKGWTRFASCFAHLDRDTLGLHIHGHRSFVVQVLNDLMAAGVFWFVEETNTLNMTMDLVGGSDTNYPVIPSDNTTAGSGYWVKLVA